MTSGRPSRSATGSASRAGSSAIAAEPGLRARLGGWLRHHVPTREKLAGNRWLRPVAHRVLAPVLWRPTHRSVPRGVALGVMTGILVPPAHFPLSAILAVPLRANIPAAALTCIVVNPFTAPAIWVAAYKVGHWMLGVQNQAGAHAAVKAEAGWLHWLFSDVGPATALGLLVITLSAMTVGYFGSVFGYRLWIARKWRRRGGAEAAA